MKCRNRVMGALALLALTGCPSSPRPPPSSSNEAVPETPAVSAPAKPVRPPSFDGVILSPTVRGIPGKFPTPFLCYTNAAAHTVAVAGSWDRFHSRTPMVMTNGFWALDMRGLKLKEGLHEFEFWSDGARESGERRRCFADETGWLLRYSDLILAANCTRPDALAIALRQGCAWPANAAVTIRPSVPVANVQWRAPSADRIRYGFDRGEGWVTFVFDPATYSVDPKEMGRVRVGGTFNHWLSAAGQSTWDLADEDKDGVWELTVPALWVDDQSPEKPARFRFVVDDYLWVLPPESAPNRSKAPDRLQWHFGNDAQDESTGDALPPEPVWSQEISENGPQAGAALVRLGGAMDIASSYQVQVAGYRDYPAQALISPSPFLEMYKTPRPLGVEVDTAKNQVVYRVYSPRARQVWLEFHSVPGTGQTARAASPVESIRLAPLTGQGCWEVARTMADVGRWYSFRIEGPEGTGEEFDGAADVSDPLATAVAGPLGPARVVNPEETNEWFSGWSDQDFKAAALPDAVIYTAHVRDLVSHASSGVDVAKRGVLSGLADTADGTVGLAHLKNLGITHVRLLPLAESGLSDRGYGWGYASDFFCAPESSYGLDPLRGSACFELKRLVDTLHKMGMGVIVDLGITQPGKNQSLGLLDTQYFYRRDIAGRLTNQSGAGRDLRTEAPVAREMIMQAVRRWVSEYHVDGFRFSQAELIDYNTLRHIEHKTLAIKPDLIFITDPSSPRGDHRHDLKATAWTIENEDFSRAIVDFVRGRPCRELVKKAVRAGTDDWAKFAYQTLNTLENQGDISLADQLKTSWDGTAADPELARKRAWLAATMQFTTLGVPALNEGQEWGMTRVGRPFTEAAGEKTNAVDWSKRDDETSASLRDYYKALIAMRRDPLATGLKPVEKPADTYVYFFEPEDNPQAIGWLINAHRQVKSGVWAVFINASDHPQVFRAFMPAGNWKIVGDGESVKMEGFPAPEELGHGTMRFRVKANSAMILVAPPLEI